MNLLIIFISFLLVVSLNDFIVHKAIAQSNNTFDYSTDGLEAPPHENQLQISDFLAAIGIAASFLTYWLKERSDKRNTMRRSCDAILTEIRENHDALTTKKHNRVSYTTDGNMQEVNYTNAYLDTDAYESILHSGLLTHFSGNTQNRLIQLYTRIKSHNDMITYTNEYEDEFFQMDNSQERQKRWFEEVRRYDLILTKWEKEIVELLETVEPMIESQKPKSFLKEQ